MHPLLTDLQAVVANYQPYDEQEREHLQQLRAFMERGGLSLFARSNQIGQITASAFVIDHSGTRTLLTHHAKLDRWLQFGGHIEDDVDCTIAGAALREAAEESGIEKLTLVDAAIFDIDVHPIPDSPKKNEGTHLHFDIRFLLRAATNEFSVTEESNDLRWCTVDEAMTLLGYDAGVQRMLAKWQERFTQTVPR